jgi:hypothetical protein
MKKSILIAILLAFGWVSGSQAVVIHWAATTSYAFSFAQLVYVDNDHVGNATYIANSGSLIGSQLSGGNIVSGAGVYENSQTDNTSRTGGAYYVVLFNNLNVASYVSLNSLSPSSTGGEIGTSSMNPGGGYFNGGATGWTPVPEPGTLALVGLGAAALVIRRRRMRK